MQEAVLLLMCLALVSVTTMIIMVVVTTEVSAIKSVINTEVDVTFARIATTIIAMIIIGAEVVITTTESEITIPRPTEMAIVSPIPFALIRAIHGIGSTAPTVLGIKTTIIASSGLNQQGRT